MDKLNDEIINLGNPDEYKIMEFAQIIKELTHSKSLIIFKDLPQDDPTLRRSDITLAKKKLRWQPKMGLYKGKRVINYFEEMIKL